MFVLTRSKIFYFLILFLAFPFWNFAQAPRDSTKLPFAIADEKRLSDDDLKNKKEGFYVTGEPDISSDPVDGFGLGVEGSLFYDGKRSDPFFNYTPYRSRLDFEVFYTTKQQRVAKAKFDVPYIFNSKWRLRIEAGYEVNPNLLYFGKDETSLNPLTDPSGKTYSTYSGYQNGLSHTRSGKLPFENPANNYTDWFYNTYQKEEYILNVNAEHAYMDGRLHLLAGFEIAYVNITTFEDRNYADAIDPISGNTSSSPNGLSKVKNDVMNDGALGYGKNSITFIQLGVVYDTRDLETDPTKGLFWEVTNEFSNHAIGSSFNFNKSFTQIKYYLPLFPSAFKKFILATRFGIGYTTGDAPFFELQDEWGSEGSIEGLGGAHTIRGYKQARFLGRVMDFGNVELRFRFGQANILKQHLAFSAVPFFDVGGTWNDLSRITNFNNYRYSPGIGLRIAWDVNTILRFDYAVSKEDAQFFFNIGHTF